MVSSTFADLQSHRGVLIRAIMSQSLMPVAMESDSAKPDVDVIDASLKMVQDASAYIGVIGYKYGQVPQCERRNPDGLSLTELELNEARRLGRPILLFVMGDGHYVKRADVEQDPEKTAKLDAFRQNAKRIQANSSLHRVYKVFNDIHEFEVAATQSLADLRRHLDANAMLAVTSQQFVPLAESSMPRLDLIPKAPAFYAEPAYIGSHPFVGRQAQLETLCEWATSADSHAVLLFEAIGGAGKSMLTWEWTLHHAPLVREDWAGRFWYSFYERGATMLDFCRRALAYMTGQPRARFRERSVAELSQHLLPHLRARPWLIVLDGLERVLVAYHRIDAAQLPDDEAGTADQIARRDPCAATNPEDDDLIRALAGAYPSKCLLTSRLVPRVLLNRSGLSIPGVLRERLPGLRPSDAEALIRACGIAGSSVEIQHYLKSHCDCHPLVIGVLAGIINDYLPDRGNFDAWAADEMGGGQLNLANLDLVQKRNHILAAALTALPDPSRQLLSTLALLSESVDYSTLLALNPHLPPAPEVVPEPSQPWLAPRWNHLSEQGRAKAMTEYELALIRRREYEEVIASRQAVGAGSVQELAKTVSDLERRGLLQYDTAAKRHDLHPVVRGFAAGGLRLEERTIYGQRVIDHFSQQAHDPYEKARTLEDFGYARHIVKAFIQMGKLDEARRFIVSSDFVSALNYYFEAHNEILTIIKPFFSAGWSIMPAALENADGRHFAKRAAVALRRIGALEEALSVLEAELWMTLRRGRGRLSCKQLLNIASTLGMQGRLAQEDCVNSMATALATVTGEREDINATRLARFRQLSSIGKRTEAEALWNLLRSEPLADQSGPRGLRTLVAHHYAVHLFHCGELSEEVLAETEALSRENRNALGTRDLCALRGEWRVQQQDWVAAKQSLQEAVALARKAGKIDKKSEILLELVKYHLDQLPGAIECAEQLSTEAGAGCQGELAELWLAIGARDRAQFHALAAYKRAWADGEPFVRRYQLERASRLLENVGVAIPVLRRYDPEKAVRLSWEEEVLAAIEKMGRPKTRETGLKVLRQQRNLSS